ncbi:MAG: hypothetical protein AAGI53_17585 [Planctomycetota bacterium]
MTERYPDDAELLALDADAHTGVEYIPTGTTPYYLEFRRLVQRSLLAAARASDLRVYADGDLTVGIRPGRCLIDAEPIVFAGQTQTPLSANDTTDLYLDQTGVVQLSTTGLPAARSQFVPLARITTDATSIVSILDLRGEAFLAAPPSSLDGLTASAGEINQALDGIDPSVTSSALNALTSGSTLQSLHYHDRFVWDTTNAEWLTLLNLGASGANIGLRFDLLNALPAVTELAVDTTNGFLTQAYNGQTFHLLGVSHATTAIEGPVTASLIDRLIGAAPTSGVVSEVVLTIGDNTVSSDATDGLTATVYRNGTAVCTIDPQITSGNGTGTRSTAQGHGTPSVVKSDGSEQVQRGDLFTVDLTWSSSGTVSTNPRHVGVIVVIKADQPG